MRVWKLSVDIDGFGGNERDKYFLTESAAVKDLEKHPGVWHHFDEEKKEMTWDIEGMKEIIYTESDRDILTNEKANKVISIVGIPYPEKERDEWSIRWCRIFIEEMEIPGFPYKNRLFVLCEKAGYCEYVDAAFQPGYEFIENPVDKPENRRTEILTTFSKNYARKYARSHCKRLPRIWIKKEEEEYISPLGNGMDFLTIEEYKISEDGLDELTPENVDAIFFYCLADYDEGLKQIRMVEGITHKFVLHRERVEHMKQHIANLLDQLPVEFKESTGGGYSFLCACNDKNGKQWTGMHAVMERLFVLGYAANKAANLLPRKIWSALPGGVPYIVVYDDFREEKENPELKKELKEAIKEINKQNREKVKK